MKQPPCKDCLCVPTCRNRAWDDGSSQEANCFFVTVMAHTCYMLDSYLHEAFIMEQKIPTPVISEYDMRLLAVRVVFNVPFKSQLKDNQ
ncbi:MAG: hypothetical protein ACTSW1_07790 [Candidatus Hodarchaeales archaeon]